MHLSEPWLEGRIEASLARYGLYVGQHLSKPRVGSCKYLRLSSRVDVARDEAHFVDSPVANAEACQHSLPRLWRIGICRVVRPVADTGVPILVLHLCKKRAPVVLT